MRMIKTLATKMLAILALVALVAPPATAQGLNASDMALAFGDNTPTAARSMNAVEMDEREGAWIGTLVKAIGKALSMPTPKAAPKVTNPGSSGGPGAGKGFSQAQKDADIGKPCAYCGKPTIQSPKPHPDRLHNDHIIPKSQGGNYTSANLNPLCQTCNLQKARSQ
jgi:hypothetical protein